MYKKANLTGDVVDSRNFEPDGDLYFLLREGNNRYMISLEQVFECLRFAEENHEIEPLPEALWINALSRYPDMYKGEEYEDEVQAAQKQY